MNVRISVTLPQFRPEADPMLDAARRAEDMGFDGVYVFDHLFPLGSPDRPIFEGFVALGAVAAVTSTITIGTLVVRAPIRPAWTTAKAAWSAHAISGGRLTLGLGAADSLSRPEFEAYGLSFGSAAERIETVRQTIAALHAPELQLPGFSPPKTWIGGRSPAVRAVAAEVADGWNAWGGSVDRLARESAEIREQAGRPLEVSWGGQVLLAPDGANLAERLADRDDPDQLVAGTPEVVAEHLRALAAAGADELVLSLLPSPGLDPWDLFVEEVRPLLG
ncbi:MAG: LLM class flavin-dependent oxidoreductase [Acidimicrobiia bacterium]|nr:LLM class flavin-dependent oxidoreductase [Acidimicrobiia bacterium]